MIDIYAFNTMTANGMNAGGVKIQSIPAANESEINIMNPTVKSDMGNAESMDFSLQPGSTYYDSFIQMRTYIRVQYGTENNYDVIFYGRVLTISEGYFGERKVHCEGALAFLNDTCYPGTQKKNKHSISIKKHISNVLKNHNALVSNDSKRKIEMGEVPGNYTGATSSEQRIENKSREFGSSSWSTTKSVLEDLKSHYGGFFRIRYDNGHHYLDWMNHYFRYTVNAQSVRTGSNLIDISSSREISNIFTAIIPIGKPKSGDDPIYITGYEKNPISEREGQYIDAEDLDIDPETKNFILVPEVYFYYTDSQLNSGYHTVDDYVHAVEKYGLIYKTVSFDDAHTKADLFDKAIEWIKDNYQDEVVTFSVKAVDLYMAGENTDRILLGDRVTLIFSTGPTSSNNAITYRTINRTCTSVTYDLFNPENNQYTFGIPANSLGKNYGDNTSKSGKKSSAKTQTPPEESDDNPSSDQDVWKNSVQRWMNSHKVWKNSTGGVETGPNQEIVSEDNNFIHMIKDATTGAESYWELWEPPGINGYSGGRPMWVRDSQGRPAGHFVRYESASDLTYGRVCSHMRLEYIKDEFGVNLRDGSALAVPQPAVTTDADGNTVISPSTDGGSILTDGDITVTKIVTDALGNPVVDENGNVERTNYDVYHYGNLDGTIIVTKINEDETGMKIGATHLDIEGIDIHISAQELIEAGIVDPNTGTMTGGFIAQKLNDDQNAKINLSSINGTVSEYVAMGLLSGDTLTGGMIVAALDDGTVETLISGDIVDITGKLISMGVIDPNTGSLTAGFIAGKLNGDARAKINLSQINGSASEYVAMGLLTNDTLDGGVLVQRINGQTDMLITADKIKLNGDVSLNDVMSVSNQNVVISKPAFFGNASSGTYIMGDSNGSYIRTPELILAASESSEGESSQARTLTSATLASMIKEVSLDETTSPPSLVLTRFDGTTVTFSKASSDAGVYLSGGDLNEAGMLWRGQGELYVVARSVTDDSITASISGHYLRSGTKQNEDGSVYRSGSEFYIPVIDHYGNVPGVDKETGLRIRVGLDSRTFTRNDTYNFTLSSTSVGWYQVKVSVGVYQEATWSGEGHLEVQAKCSDGGSNMGAPLIRNLVTGAKQNAGGGLFAGGSDCYIPILANDGTYAAAVATGLRVKVSLLSTTFTRNNTYNFTQASSGVGWYQVRVNVNVYQTAEWSGEGHLEVQTKCADGDSNMGNPLIRNLVTGSKQNAGGGSFAGGSACYIPILANDGTSAAAVSTGLRAKVDLLSTTFTRNDTYNFTQVSSGVGWYRVKVSVNVYQTAEWSGEGHLEVQTKCADGDSNMGDPLIRNLVTGSKQNASGGSFAGGSACYIPILANDGTSAAAVSTGLRVKVGLSESETITANGSYTFTPTSTSIGWYKINVNVPTLDLSSTKLGVVGNTSSAYADIQLQNKTTGIQISGSPTLRLTHVQGNRSSEGERYIYVRSDGSNISALNVKIDDYKVGWQNARNQVYSGVPSTSLSSVTLSWPSATVDGDAQTKTFTLSIDRDHAYVKVGGNTYLQVDNTFSGGGDLSNIKLGIVPNTGETAYADIQIQDRTTSTQISGTDTLRLAVSLSGLTAAGKRMIYVKADSSNITKTGVELADYLNGCHAIWDYCNARCTAPTANNASAGTSITVTKLAGTVADGKYYNFSSIAYTVSADAVNAYIKYGSNVVAKVAHNQKLAGWSAAFALSYSPTITPSSITDYIAVKIPVATPTDYTTTDQQLRIYKIVTKTGYASLQLVSKTTATSGTEVARKAYGFKSNTWPSINTSFTIEGNRCTYVTQTVTESGSSDTDVLCSKTIYLYMAQSGTNVTLYSGSSSTSTPSTRRLVLPISGSSAEVSIDANAVGSQSCAAGETAMNAFKSGATHIFSSYTITKGYLYKFKVTAGGSTKYYWFGNS